MGKQHKHCNNPHCVSCFDTVIARPENAKRALQYWSSCSSTQKAYVFVPLDRVAVQKAVHECVKGDLTLKNDIFRRYCRESLDVGVSRQSVVVHAELLNLQRIWLKSLTEQSTVWDLSNLRFIGGKADVVVCHTILTRWSRRLFGLPVLAMFSGSCKSNVEFLQQVTLCVLLNRDFFATLLWKYLAAFFFLFTPLDFLLCKYWFHCVHLVDVPFAFSSRTSWSTIGDALGPGLSSFLSPIAVQFLSTLFIQLAKEDYTFTRTMLICFVLSGFSLLSSVVINIWDVLIVLELFRLGGTELISAVRGWRRHYDYVLCALRWHEKQVLASNAENERVLKAARELKAKQEQVLAAERAKEQERSALKEKMEALRVETERQKKEAERLEQERVRRDAAERKRKKQENALRQAERRRKTEEMERVRREAEESRLEQLRIESNKVVEKVKPIATAPPPPPAPSSSASVKLQRKQQRATQVTHSVQSVIHRRSRQDSLSEAQPGGRRNRQDSSESNNSTTDPRQTFSGESPSPRSTLSRQSSNRTVDPLNSSRGSTRVSESLESPTERSKTGSDATVAASATATPGSELKQEDNPLQKLEQLCALLESTETPNATHNADAAVHLPHVHFASDTRPWSTNSPDERGSVQHNYPPGYNYSAGGWNSWNNQALFGGAIQQPLAQSPELNPRFTGAALAPGAPTYSRSASHLSSDSTPQKSWTPW